MSLSLGLGWSNRYFLEQHRLMPWLFFSLGLSWTRECCPLERRKLAALCWSRETGFPVDQQAFVLGTESRHLTEKMNWQRAGAKWLRTGATARARVASHLFFGVAGMADRDDSLWFVERRQFGRNFESKAVVEFRPTRWGLSCKNARNSLTGGRRRKL